MFEVNGLYIIHMVLNMKITPTSISYVYGYCLYIGFLMIVLFNQKLRDYRWQGKY